MSGKVITVWGAAGSGKTTVAVNLAAAISQRNLMVGIISSKFCYGEMQSLFGKRVENDKGMYRAMLNGCNMKNMFSETGNPNLFFLSVPNGFDGMLLSAVSGDTVNELISNSLIMFDYVIIDGSEELNNPVSSIGLTLASKVVTVHRASAKDSIWFSSMHNMQSVLHIKDKSVHVLNAYDKTCDKAAFIGSIDAKMEFELPYIQNAKILENSGRLIYDSPVSAGVYKKTVQRLASVVCMGG